MVFPTCPHCVSLVEAPTGRAVGWRRHYWHRDPSSVTAGAGAMPTAPGAAEPALSLVPGLAGLRSLPFCREARHLPTRQPGDPHAGCLHEPVQDGLQLLRDPEVLQKWLWQGVLRDTPPLRSVGHPPTTGFPQHLGHGTHVPILLMASSLFAGSPTSCQPAHREAAA